MRLVGGQRCSAVATRRDAPRRRHPAAAPSIPLSHQRRHRPPLRRGRGRWRCGWAQRRRFGGGPQQATAAVVAGAHAGPVLPPAGGTPAAAQAAAQPQQAVPPALAWDWVFKMRAVGGGSAGGRNGGVSALGPHRPWLLSSPALTLGPRYPWPAASHRLNWQPLNRSRQFHQHWRGIGNFHLGAAGSGGTAGCNGGMAAVPPHQAAAAVVIGAHAGPVLPPPVTPLYRARRCRPWREAVIPRGGPQGL